MFDDSAGLEGLGSGEEFMAAGGVRYMLAGRGNRMAIGEALEGGMRGHTNPDDCTTTATGCGRRRWASVLTSAHTAKAIQTNAYAHRR